jgi:hypothetical protein
MSTDLKITRRDTYGHMLSGIRVPDQMWEAMRARMASLDCSLSEYVRALVEADLAAQSATQKRSARV